MKKILQKDLEDFWVNPKSSKRIFLDENGFFGFFRFWRILEILQMDFKGFWRIMESGIWIFCILKDFGNPPNGFQKSSKGMKTNTPKRFGFWKSSKNLDFPNPHDFFGLTQTKKKIWRILDFWLTWRHLWPSYNCHVFYKEHECL